MSCDCGVSSVEGIAISSARSVSTLASCAFKFRLRILSASFHDNNSVVFSLLSAFQPLLAIYYMSKARTCIRFNSAYQMRFSALTPLPFYVCLFISLQCQMLFSRTRPFWHNPVWSCRKILGISELEFCWGFFIRCIFLRLKVTFSCWLLNVCLEVEGWWWWSEFVRSVSLCSRIYSREV